jgi:hypothetical protein
MWKPTLIIYGDIQGPPEWPISMDHACTIRRPQEGKQPLLPLALKRNHQHAAVQICHRHDLLPAAAAGMSQHQAQSESHPSALYRFRRCRSRHESPRPGGPSTCQRSSSEAPEATEGRGSWLVRQRRQTQSAGEWRRKLPSEWLTARSITE